MRLTKDDERARRICSLALEFMNARRPVSSSEVWHGFYPHLSADSFRRAFSRDRQALAACGVHVREHDGGSAESSWSADREISFAQGPELEAAEAAALHIACLPLLADPGFALADELRFALAKLSRAFAESPAPGAGAAAAGGGRVLSTLRSCLVEGVAARIRYTDARGSGSERLVAPWGFLGLRGTLYLVAARVDETGAAEEGGTRTYRVDRIEAAERQAGVRFVAPEGFSVEDWRRLPFQMGPAAAEAVFEVPEDAEEGLLREAGGRGSFSRGGSGAAWTVEVSSIEDAAAWAVAHGIRPVLPPELVDAWRRVLEGACGHAA